jgi:hypothetical protein
LTGNGYADAHTGSAVDRGPSGSEALVGGTGMAPVEMMARIMSVNNTSILGIVNSSAPKDEIHVMHL